MSETRYVYFAFTAALFALVSLVHLMRAVSGWEFVIGPYSLPLAVSWVGFITTAMLSLWGLKLFTTGGASGVE